MDDRWKKRVVDFKGTCGAGWYKECVGRPCFVEILVDEVSATSVGYDRCEYGYGSEFLCISQVSIKHIKEQSSALFFRTEKHALSISVDYTAVGGQMHVIPPIYVSEHDANRVMILLNNRKERVAVLTSANYSTILDVEAMDGIEFERFVGDVFTRLGFNVEFTKATGDQGVDILARKQDEIIAIQAKCYIGRVGNNAIQQVVAGMQFYGCTSSMVVTNSYFTTPAKELADVNGTKLWDKDMLSEMIRLLY